VDHLVDAVGRRQGGAGEVDDLPIGWRRRLGVRLVDGWGRRRGNGWEPLAVAQLLGLIGEAGLAHSVAGLEQCPHLLFGCGT